MLVVAARFESNKAEAYGLQLNGIGQLAFYGFDPKQIRAEEDLRKISLSMSACR